MARFLSEREIADAILTPRDTVHGWLVEKRQLSESNQPEMPHGGVEVTKPWELSPRQILENVLWCCTDPDGVVVDALAGRGTMINAAKAMGRRVWACDREPSTPMLPIHRHDILADGWPEGAPQADLVWLDFKKFDPCHIDFLKICRYHLSRAKGRPRLGLMVRPTVTDDGKCVVDHFPALLEVFGDSKLRVETHIAIADYPELTEEQIACARENGRTFSAFYDIVILRSDGKSSQDARR